MVFIIKRYKRAICAILSAVLFLVCLAIPVSADDVLRPVITVSSASAIPGDTIVVDISISENPGIMAMTFTVAYDKDIFAFKEYRRGILSDYLVVDHPDKGYVSFVNCESRNNLIDAEVLEECYDSIYNDGDVIHYFGTSFAFNISLIITLSSEFVHKKINFRKNFFILSISDIANKPFYAF